MLIGAKITGVGAGIPKSIVTNQDLEKLVDTSDEWIRTRTGIKTRHIVKENESNSKLAIEAAIDAIGYANINPNDIDLIIVATSTPDNLYPSTACLVQGAIGASHAAAFDLEAACTGIIYALSVGLEFIKTGTYQKILVIGADVHSRLLDWEDRNTCILFGDGAGAFVIEASPGDNQILSTYLRSDGGRGHLICIPNSNSSFPHEGSKPPEAVKRFLKMNGKAIYEFAINAIPEALKTACDKANIALGDIDYLIPHQANQRIIDSVASKLNLKKEQLISNVAEVGNTSAASIPLAIWQALQAGQIKPPAICALVGFGGGLTWGASIIKWTAIDSRNR